MQNVKKYRLIGRLDNKQVISIAMLCCVFSSATFAVGYDFRGPPNSNCGASNGLCPVNSRSSGFPSSPLDMGQDGEDSSLVVANGIMQGTNGAVISNGNGHGKQINVAVGAEVTYTTSSTFGDTINVVLGTTDNNQTLTVNNSGIIRRLNSSQGNAILMNFQQSSSSYSVTNINNTGLIDGQVTVFTGGSTINTFRMNQASPSVNNGITEVTGAFIVGNFSSGTIFSVGNNANVILNAVRNIPTISMGTNAILRVRGTIGESAGQAMNQAFSIPSSSVVFIDATGAFRSNSTFTVTAGARLNIANNFTISTAAAGGFTNSGNLYIYNTGRITGNVSGGQTFNVGADSSNNLYTSTNTTTAGTIANIPIIRIYSGTFAIANAISGVTNSFTVDSGSKAVFTAALTGTNGAFINNGSTFINAGGSIGTTGAFTNAGNLNIGAAFNPGSYTSFTNTGAIYLLTGGNLTTNLTTGTSLSVGRDSDANESPNNFTANNITINLPAINIYNGSSISTSGSGTVTATNLYVLGNGTFSGSVSASVLNIGRDSFNNTDGSTAFAAGSAFSAIPSINVFNGSFTNNGFAFTNVNTAFTIANGASATLNANFSGSATSSSSNNSGTLTISSTFSLASFTNNNNGVINLQPGAVVNANIINNGTISLATTLSGTGVITNNPGSTFSIATGGVYTIPVAFTNNGTISTSGSGTLTISNPLSGTVINAGIANVTAAFTPAATTSSNSGTINVNNNGSFTIPASYSNSGTITTSGTGVLIVSNPLAGTITNGGTTTVTAAFTPSSSSSNSGTTNVNSNGSFTIPATYTNNGTITTAGTGLLTVANPLSGIVSNAGTTTVTAAFTPANTSSNSGTININSGGSFTQPVTYTYSGSININTGTAPLGSGITGNSGSILRIGNSNSVTLTLAQTITNVETISLVTSGTSFTANAAISGVNTAFNLAAGTSASIAAGLTGLGTCTNNGNLSISSTLGLAALTNNSQLTFATGTNNSTPITNILGATFNISGNTINTAAITNRGNMTVSAQLASGTITNESGGLLVFNGAANEDDVFNLQGGTFNVTGNSSNIAAISNSGTMTISAGLSQNGTILNNSSGVLTFAAGANNANAVTNNGTFTISGSATNTANITNNSSMTIAAALANSGTITNTGTLNVSSSLTSNGAITNSGSLTLANGVSTSNAITNTSGTLTIAGALTSTAAINNQGVMVINGNILMGGNTLSSTGSASSVTVNGQRSLTATSYANSGTHNTSITSESTYDSLTVSGAVNLTGSTLNVSSNFVGNKDVPYSWTVISGNAPISGPSAVLLPSTFWSYSVTSTSVIINFLLEDINYVELVTGPVNQGIAAVLQQMSLNITNNGQQQLINALNLDLDPNVFNNNVTQLQPNINASTPALMVQNAALNKIQSRIAGLKDGSVYVQGLAYGDSCNDKAFWIDGFGSIAEQNAIDTNAGYRAKSLGTMLGFDYKTDADDVYGIAFAMSNTNVYEFSDANDVTRILGYNTLLYGSNYLKGSNFLEWMLTGVVNKSKGSRAININGNNFSVTSSYHSYQGGARINIGQFTDSDNWAFSLVETLRYNFLYQPSYDENDSVAALHVSPQTYSNLLTVGGGFRLALPSEDPWLTGTREIRVMGTYDVISPENTTFANFIVGSSDFTVLNPISRWGVEFGVDFAFSICNRLQIQLSYDFTLREKYTDNAAEIKLKLLF